MLHKKLILSNENKVLKPAIFCDRDGVLIEDLHYISDPNEVFILNGAKELLNLAYALDLYFIIITNQSGIHRGFLTWSEYDEVTARMLKLLGNKGHISAIYANASGPNSQDIWRKPNIGMILEAKKDFNIDLERSILIGDRLSDLITGFKSSCKKLIHVKTGHGDKEFHNIKDHFKDKKYINFFKRSKLICINNLSEIEENLLI